MSIVKTSREWALVVLCAILFLTNFFPYGTELLHPVLDSTGNNLMNLETHQLTYRCGDIVRARMIFQKNRSITGEIRWILVPNSPGRRLDMYTARPAAMPAGIYDTWIDVEKLPNKCEPGRYHFEGIVTYPVWLGKISYSLRTTCFQITE